MKGVMLYYHDVLGFRYYSAAIFPCSFQARAFYSHEKLLLSFSEATTFLLYCMRPKGQSESEN